MFVLVEDVHTVVVNVVVQNGTTIHSSPAYVSVSLSLFAHPSTGDVPTSLTIVVQQSSNLNLSSASAKKVDSNDEQE